MSAEARVDDQPGRSQGSVGRAHMSEQEERERFMLLVEHDLNRVRHYLHSIVILLIYGGLIIIGLLGAITLKLFLG